MGKKTNLIERVPDLRNQIYERLRESLKNGEFPTVGKVAEQTVADEFGVSRTPAREALAMLVRDGALVQEGRGFTVPTYSVEDIFEVFEVRLCLEPQAMRRLAEHITQKQLRTVRTMLEVDFDDDIDLSEYHFIHRETRERLFEMAANKRLRQAIQLYEDHVHFVRERTLVNGDWSEVSRRRMRAVLKALIKRDGEAAAAAMTDVLIAARDAIIATLQADT